MILGILDNSGWYISFDEKSSCIGGSETWLQQISNAFSDLGHEVFLFVNCKFHNFKNIHYIPKNKLIEIAKEVKFDKFIFSRGSKNFDIVNSSEKCFMMHDKIISDDFNTINRFDKIYVLSNFAKNIVIKKYGKEIANKIQLTFNGIDLNLYKNNLSKTNSMVWSSRPQRGLFWFIDNIYPNIKQEISDFKLYVCSYLDIPKLKEDIICLGQLTKEQLAKYQLQSKIWCYPNRPHLDGFEELFYETFCITAIENAAAKNSIITSSFGGLGTTCNGIKFYGNDLYLDNKIIDENKYIDLLSEVCIKELKNPSNNYMNVSKYTWINAAKSFI